MEAAWTAVKAAVAVGKQLDFLDDTDQVDRTGLFKEKEEYVRRSCAEEQRLVEKSRPVLDTSQARLELVSQFCDHVPLGHFEGFFELVPQLVNVVSLCEALPHHTSVGGGKLPLDLHRIASKCTNSYFAPKRFAAIQLAFSTPRSRVLIFHTGRIVGTGCDSPQAARLAVARAQRQIAVEAGIFLKLRNFAVINQVAAASIFARLNCDDFADSHRSTAHYDRASFVGLAWRPVGESVCCEIYSTGKSNLPGSTRTFDLLTSWSRMVSELYRYSDKPERVSIIPEYLAAPHRTKAKRKRTTSSALQLPEPKCVNLWEEDWNKESFESCPLTFPCTDDDLLDLDIL